jgi:hypothetical protein
VIVAGVPANASVPVTAEGFIEPVTALLAFDPKGVIVVPFSVPVTAEVLFVPVGVTVCECVPKAEPEKVGCVKVPAAIVGTPAGHEIVG